MPDGSPTTGHYDPIHQAHALEQVVFVIQFDRQLGNAAFDTVLGSVKQISEQDFPGRAELQSFFIVGTQPAQPNPTTAAGAHGRVLFRQAPDGRTDRELRVERSSLTFRTQLYTRWSEVWGEARKQFDRLLPLYLVESNLASVSTNFIDRFVWVGNAKEATPALLLRKGCEYIAPHVYGAPDLWHSHTGAFLNADIRTKRLVNVNADHVEESVSDELKRSIVFATVFTDLFSQPGYGPLELTAATICAFVDSHMQDLHVLGKTVLGNMINDEMGRRIALV